MVYEGRGQNKESAAALHWNNKSLTFGFVGLFNSKPPSDDSLFAAEAFLQYMVDQGTLCVDARLFIVPVVI